MDNIHCSFTFKLIAKQQPKQSRMCGVGERFDRRPVDPPPIIQLVMSSKDGSKQSESLIFESPWLFMCATLLPEDDTGNNKFQLNTTLRSATGCMVSSLNQLKNLNNENGAFFVFPDISVRVEGKYRFRMTLFEIARDGVHCLNSIDTDPFTVYPAKKFPGMEESTSLSRLFAEQGLKIRIRKDVRTRRKPSRRRQLVENAVAQLETESHDLATSSEPNRSQEESLIRSNSPPDKRNQIIAAPLHTGGASTSHSSPTVTLPRNILDTHGMSLIPWQNADQKISLPPISANQSSNTSYISSHSYPSLHSPRSSNLPQQGFATARDENIVRYPVYDYPRIHPSTFDLHRPLPHPTRRRQDNHPTRDEMYPEAYGSTDRNLKRKK
ncbi:hypothetical protein K450DRAFT_223765 [Umbelopsis ramanniana AG]|uniref:Velvet domain-containing protein n=1 Tax=Umbelopsis ramanniana AG TaxID=1314678 RepID=A0AAD5HIA1_UMBRA|nr:uncharacterized protein K450DRAFT_223765 [Umbelopsis ramanniana AG]KAI8583456.1 hypothetical protein K450DRAFT_223765 [Umbelopsis ramanniana AG]